MTIRLHIRRPGPARPRSRLSPIPPAAPCSICYGAAASLHGQIAKAFPVSPAGNLEASSPSASCASGSRASGRPLSRVTNSIQSLRCGSIPLDRNITAFLGTANLASLKLVRRGRIANKLQERKRPLPVFRISANPNGARVRNQNMIIRRLQHPSVANNHSAESHPRRICRHATRRHCLCSIRCPEGIRPLSRPWTEPGRGRTTEGDPLQITFSGFRRIPAA